MSASAPAAREAMDNIYRYQRYIYDATRAYYLLGRDRLIAELSPPAGGSILEVGCGTGRNLLHTAQRYPSADLYGFDISAAMLDTAGKAVARKGRSASVKLAEGDATAFDAEALFGCPQFDRVFISYTLSMVPMWESVVAGAARCIAPGGSLSIVDFGDFADYPAVARRAQLAWLRQFSVKPIPQLEDRLAQMAIERGLTPDIKRLYGGYAVLARLSQAPAH